ncbi:MAG: FAD synthetase family protein [Puniceicoccales bacterium]|jgi:riboflavin kinase/FMN adenylyltransferase|nr:FAD synthetase family protein [Puniceicoccales bacterium]
MKIIETLFDEKIMELAERKVVLAIGVFDGVHIGHRFLLKQMVALADELEAVPVAYTFWPYPTHFHAKNRKKMIISRERKFEILDACGIQCVVEQCFEENFAKILPEDFISFLKRKFNSLIGICVGSNFKFGHERTGDVTHHLKELCDANNLVLHIIDEILMGGEPVSSSRIRTLLDGQDFAFASELLGGNSIFASANENERHWDLKKTLNRTQ